MESPQEYLTNQSEDLSEECVNELDCVIRRLTEFAFRNQTDIKRLKLFFGWINAKSSLVQVERDYLHVPISALPKRIHVSQYTIQKNRTKWIIRQAYTYDESQAQYILKESPDIENADKDRLIREIVFRKSSVVWVEFGFNIGSEFGGRHPAIIVKSIGECLYVIPLSTQTPNNPDAPYQVKIGKVYNFEYKDRWACIHNMRPISIHRVDLTARIGSISRKDMDKITQSISDCFAKGIAQRA